MVLRLNRHANEIHKLVLLILSPDRESSLKIIWELIIKQSFRNNHHNRTRMIPQKYPKSSDFRAVVFVEASNLQRQLEFQAYCTVLVAEIYTQFISGIRINLIFKDSVDGKQNWLKSKTRSHEIL